MTTTLKEKTSLFQGFWIDGAGPISATILLVGLAPGATEIKVGEPFVGPAGKMLQECAAEARLDWSSVRRTNVIRCLLPENRKPTDEELAEYLPWLLEEIESMPNLRVIVALGNEAMKALTKKSGITDKRGEEMEWGPHRLILLPTFHPSFILRKRSQRQTLVKDLVRANRLSKGETMLDPGRAIFVETFPVPLNSTARLSVDVETDGQDRPRLVGFGEDPDEVYVTRASDAYRALSRIDAKSYVGHNFRADLKWLKTIGVEFPLNRLEDTMLKAHLLNENRSMGLKKLALELLDPELYWKFVEPKLRKAATRDSIPYDQLGEYCADDVAATLLVDDVLSVQLAQQPRLMALYRHMSLPLSSVLLEAETNGILFDAKKANQLSLALHAERGVLENDLDRLAGAVPGTINWRSNDQVAALFYGKLGMIAPKRTEGKGRGAVDKESLMKIRDAHPIVRVRLKWSELEKKEEIIATWLKRQRADGRVYPSYNQTGTVTGRLSGSNPNPQNVPTDDRIRGLIVSPPGWSILSADYATIELGTGAWIFDEPTMLAAYIAGEDLHTLTATRLLGRPPADKEERKKYGKTPNFGLLYQQGDEGFRDYAEKMGVTMTLHEASQMRAAWHTLYPGVRAGWRRIGLEMKASGGTLVAPSGRMRRLPEFLSGSRGLVNEAWRAGCNFPIQCTAAEFTHIAAILATPYLRQHCGARLILHVHDSLAFEIPNEYIHSAATILKTIMEVQVPAYFESHFGAHIPIPLRVDVGAGPAWGSLTKV